MTRLGKGHCWKSTGNKKGSPKKQSPNRKNDNRRVSITQESNKGQYHKGRKIPTNKEVHALNGNTTWMSTPSIIRRTRAANEDKREFRVLDFTFTEVRTINNLIAQFKTTHRMQQDKIIGIQMALARAESSKRKDVQRQAIVRERNIYYSTLRP